MSAAVQPPRTEKPPASRPQIPLARLFLLTVATAAFAFGLQALLAATEAPAADAISLLVVPLAAAAVIFFGLRPYPTAGRLRLAGMAGAGLFLLGLIL